MKRKSLKEKVLSLKGVNEYNINYAFKLLPSIKKAIGGKNGRVYCTVNTVARSGMSRTISVIIPHKGNLINLNHTPFWSVYGDSQTKNGDIRIGGCGMDMLFEATYRLYNFLYTRNRPYQKHLNRYSTL